MGMTVVHMWNKNYGYPFYAEKEEIPVHCQIDDDNGIQSSTPGKQSSKSKNNTDSNTTAEKLRRVREEKLTALIDNISESVCNNVSSHHEMIVSISETRQLIEKYEKDVNTYREISKKKRKKYADKSDKVNNIKQKYQKKIDEARSMINALEKSIKKQRIELEEFNKNVDCDGSNYTNSDSDSSDGS